MVIGNGNWSSNKMNIGSGHAVNSITPEHSRIGDSTPGLFWG